VECKLVVALHGVHAPHRLCHGLTANTQQILKITAAPQQPIHSFHPHRIRLQSLPLCLISKHDTALLPDAAVSLRDLALLFQPN